MSSPLPFRGLPGTSASRERVTLLVLSHRRWGAVFDRPQHVLTRLARDCDILFVEEPVHDAGEPRLDIAIIAPGVEVVTPRLDDPAPGFADVHLMPLGRMLDALLAERRIHWPLVWFYTPMALPVLKYLEPRGIVYDCMEDLASFRFAPPELLAREGRLLDIADVVLTGSPSLQASRKPRRPDARCLPNAVDVDRFARSTLDPRSPEAARAKALHVGISSPRLGYMDVIDERLDLPLIDDLAARRPDWSLVMVGPVVRIDEATLPRRANIHWFGVASDRLLPYLLPYWDVALLPFALDDATRLTSPARTLEYLAGGLDVVSTPVPDVMSLYGQVVRIAQGAAGFEGAIEDAMQRPGSRRDGIDRLRQSLLDASTWDAMVAQVIAAIEPWLGEQVPAHERGQGGAASARTSIDSRVTPPPPHDREVQAATARPRSAARFGAEG